MKEPILRLLFSAPTKSRPRQNSYTVSMKTREREIARAGIFGSTDNPVVVKESDLEEIAQTFPEQKTAPIKLGSHYTEDRPRLAQVTAVRYDKSKKTLYATIQEQDALAKAVDDDGLLFSKPKNCGYEIYLSTDSHGRKIYPLYGSWLENNGKLELLKRYGKDRVFPQLKGIKYTIPRYLGDTCDECGKYLPEDSLIPIDGLGTDFYCCPDCAEKVRRYSYKTCEEISEMEA